MEYPTFSIIIPAFKQGSYDEVVNSLKKLEYPLAKIEVIISLGRNPSLQRNLAIKKATGEFTLFLDNDSIVSSQLLKEILNGFQLKRRKPYEKKNNPLIRLSIELTNFIFKNKVRDERVIIVGGPNINLLPFNSFWQEIADSVLQSTFVHWKMAARYRPIGDLRFASEKELILCNLAIANKVLGRKVNFNELLYPNEENELIQRLIKQKNFGFVYNPKAIISRSRRSSLNDILRQFFYYGKGRMEQIKITGLKDNLIFLAPLFLLVYFISTPFLLLQGTYIIFLPLLVYFSFAFLSSLGFALKNKNKILFLVLPSIYIFIHLVYAFGLTIGIFTNFSKKKKSNKKIEDKIKIEFLKKFNQNNF